MSKEGWLRKQLEQVETESNSLPEWLFKDQEDGPVPESGDSGESPKAITEETSQVVGGSS